MLLAIVEIQFAIPSWHAVYGFTRRFMNSSLLDSANHFPEKLSIGAVIIATWIHRPEARRTIGAALLAIGIASAITGVIKEITGRARPTWGVRVEEHPENMQELSEYILAHNNPVLRAQNGDYWLWLSEDRPWGRGDYASFPSGHATSAFAFAVWLAVIYPRGKGLWYALAVLTCLARIRFRRHHPGDVIFGGAVGYLTAQLVLSSPWALRLSAWASAQIERVPLLRGSVASADSPRP